jgi:hypothetical protein
MKTARWTPEQDRLLGTDHDRVIAARIGRTAAAVRARRAKLGIPPYSGWAAKGRGWTAEELALLGTDDDRVIAARIGRTPAAVRQKRHVARIQAASGPRRAAGGRRPARPAAADEPDKK